MRQAEWMVLVEGEPDSRRWFENLSCGSAGTAGERARVLYRFLGVRSIETTV